MNDEDKVELASVPPTSAQVLQSASPAQLELILQTLNLAAANCSPEARAMVAAKGAPDPVRARIEAASAELTGGERNAASAPNDAREPSVAEVLAEMARVLSEAPLADLEKHFQSIDQILERKSLDLRRRASELLWHAAEQAPDSTKTRILTASGVLNTGGRCARVYDPTAPMPKHAFLDEPVPYRKVTSKEFTAAMKEANAVDDPSFRSTGVGEHARYRDPDGKLVGLIVVRYWHGEEDFDFYTL